MKLRRKHAVLLLAVAAWNVFSYATFTKNLAAAYTRGEDRPTGYWVAHVVLIIVNLVIAAVLGRLGFQVWRATRPTARAAGPEVADPRTDTPGVGAGTGHNEADDRRD